MATPENVAAYREAMGRVIKQQRRGIITSAELMNQRIELMCEHGVTDAVLLDLVAEYLDELFAVELSPAVLDELHELAQ